MATKTIIIFLLQFTLLSFISQTNREPTQEDVARGSKVFTGLTLSDLIKGKTIFELHCVKCHALKDPESQTQEEWYPIVPKMVRRANKKAGKEIIDSTSANLILKYVVTMSLAKVN